MSDLHGVLVLDKPQGISSAAAVDKVKRALGVSRAGHGGTLDPIATGVLAVCLGAATKLAGYLLADDKEYEATGELGVEMDTLDRTGLVTRTRAEEASQVTRDALLHALVGRSGAQMQVPPMYSAIKKDGVRMYQMARAGGESERDARPIRIDRLELGAFAPPRFVLTIACSKGTYVRSLLADIGNDVGCGANMTALRRTRSGKFAIAQATTLDDVLAGRFDPAQLVALKDAVSLPIVVVSGDQISTIKSGVQVPVERMGAENLEKFQFVDGEGRMLAIAHAHEGKVVYDRVLPEMFREP